MTVTTAAAISIPPSQNWVGADGPWSPFALRIGTPAQNFDVLISTASTDTLVVLPLGCTTYDSPNCPSLRGGTFVSNASSTWVSKGIYVLALEENLGYTGNGQYGFDTVGLGYQGSGGPTLTGQVVGGYATRSFYLGLFGVVPRPSNFSSFNDEHPSFLQTLKKNGTLPSLSYGYTAGAPYRLDKVLGSLTLGGYDLSRCGPTNLTFPMNPIDSRDLSLNIQSITASVNDNNNATIFLLPNPVYAFIDSTIPHLWLPLEACQQFEAAFGLVWDTATGLYLVNDTQHTALKARNASFTFQLSVTAESAQKGQSINITLPYEAFDLQAEFPLIPSRNASDSTRYFPLKRAANDTQYTLGRAFLQEAYLTADYERSTFTLSQASFPDPSVPQRLVTILPPNRIRQKQSHLSTPSIAGIIIGVLAFLIAIIAPIMYFCVYKPLRDKSRNEQAQATSETRDEVLGDGKPELHAEGVERPRYEVHGDMIEVPATELGNRDVGAGELEAVESRGTYELEGGGAERR